MAVITLARQVGSGGQTIASRLAERLGYALHARRTLFAAAQARGFTLPEAFADFADEDRLRSLPLNDPHQVYLSYGELEFDDHLSGDAIRAARSSASVLDRLARDRRTVFLLSQALIYEVAAADRAIIVGAGGQLLLQGIPGVLRVKIIAPAAVRAERLAAAYGLSRAAAEAAVRRGDHEQRAFNRLVYDADWDDPLLWDLVINTETWEVEDVCDQIAHALAQPRFAAGPTQPMLDALALAGRVDVALHFAPVLATAIVFATPAADGLLLQGNAATARQAEHAVALARSLAGGTPVRNAIVVPAEPLASPA